MGGKHVRTQLCVSSSRIRPCVLGSGSMPPGPAAADFLEDMMSGSGSGFLDDTMSDKKDKKDKDAKKAEKELKKAEKEAKKAEKAEEKEAARKRPKQLADDSWHEEESSGGE